MCAQHESLAIEGVGSRDRASKACCGSRWRSNGLLGLRSGLDGIRGCRNTKARCRDSHHDATRNQAMVCELAGYHAYERRIRRSGLTWLVEWRPISSAAQLTHTQTHTLRSSTFSPEARALTWRIHYV